MSAWIVSKQHIDALVTSFLGLHTFSFRQAQTPADNNLIGQMLWDANYRSVNYRYDRKDSAPEYIFAPVNTFENKKLTTVDILKLIDCYEYQSCENIDWPKSQAYAFCDSLRRDLISKVDGYRDAPWGI